MSGEAVILYDHSVHVCVTHAKLETEVQSCVYIQYLNVTVWHVYSMFMLLSACSSLSPHTLMFLISVITVA